METKYKVKVRYSFLLKVDDFLVEREDLRPQTMCVVHTERGVELGTVLTRPERVEGEGVSSKKFILRILTESDRKKLDEIQRKQEEEFRFCRKRIQERKLPMKLSRVEHLFGGEKIIFYFLADGRIDFRNLVKDLARQYHTRIEMKQVGARDEARLLGEVGHCGEQLCCTRFIKKFEPVTMRMAKNQKATLDPRKISGVCGKLLCCLRYEDEYYTEVLSQLPAVGSVIKTHQGTGRVIGVDALKKAVQLHIEGKGKVEAKQAEIEEVISAPPQDGPGMGRDGKSGS
ncbi:MAG: stage 0 sporulation protein [Planctomycetota bacterium]|nr:MAG: stage 0 sporulation protein [Planctomycetota bacterium]